MQAHRGGRRRRGRLDDGRRDPRLPVRAWGQAGKLHQYDLEGFDATSWLAVHASMGHWPEHTDPSLGDMARGEALAGLQWRRECIAKAVAGMRRHDVYLRGMLGR